MAKKARSKSVSPNEELKEDKVEKLSLMQLLKDDRTRKIAGSFFLLFCFCFHFHFGLFIFAPWLKFVT